MILPEFTNLADQLWVDSTQAELADLAKACIYGSTYNRGLSESFFDYAMDKGHEAKRSIFMRELKRSNITI